MSLTEEDKKDVREIVREEIGASPVIGELKTDLRRLEVRFEHQEDKIDRMAESVESVLEIVKEMRPTKERVDAHEADIGLLKSVVTEHSRVLEQLQTK